MDSIESKKLSIIRILQILQDYSDCNHILTQDKILELLEKNYGMILERKAVGRSIELLADMFEKDYYNDDKINISLTIDKRHGCYFDKRLFEDSELKLIIDSILSSKHITEKDTSILIEKLCKLSNKYFKSNVKNIYSVKEWSKTNNRNIFYNIEIIQEAILNHKQVKFNYNKYGIDKKLHVSAEHIVSPYQLIIHNQRYYLISLSEKWKNIFYLRLDKITDIEITEISSTPLNTINGFENGIDYNLFSSSLPYMFSDKIEKIEFIADEKIIDDVVDWFGDKAFIVKDNDNKIKVSVMASPYAMKYWAMQYLNFVEITSPIELRNTIKEELKKSMKKYEQ